MVRRGGPSRGCKTCRERRIKCDETLPACKRCLQVGRQCPGPIAGAFFVDMTDAAAGASAAAGSSVPVEQKAKGKPSAVILRSSSSAPPSQLPIRAASDTGLNKPTNEPEPDGVDNFNTVALTTDRKKRHSEALGIAAHQFQLPSSYQPSRAVAFQQHFVSHLISSLHSPVLHRTRLRSWAFELPTLLTSASPTTIYSIRAAAMAFYGIMTGDESIQTDACQWYAKGLMSQRSLLQKCPMGGLMEMPTMEEVSAPVMFSIFEVVACTNPRGWIHHLSAASKMLEMRGPENCRDGTIHTLFRTLRLSSVFVTVTTEIPSIFASDPWRSIPFSLNPKSMFDKLVDILLQLPDCLARRNQMKELSAQNSHKSEAIRTELKMKALLLVSQLDNWWRQYEKEAVEEDGEAWLYQPIPSQKHLEVGEENEYSPKTIIYRNAATAVIISLYHAASVIAYHLLLVISPSLLYEEHVVSNADSVLSSARFWISDESSGYGLLLMIFPLKVVYLLTLDEQQRGYAWEMLARLGRKNRANEICSRATPVFRRRYQ